MEKNQTPQEAKTGFFAKIGNFFKTIGQFVVRTIKNLFAEIKSAAQAWWVITKANPGIGFLMLAGTVLALSMVGWLVTGAMLFSDVMTASAWGVGAGLIAAVGVWLWQAGRSAYRSLRTQEVLV